MEEQEEQEGLQSPGMVKSEAGIKGEQPADKAFKAKRARGSKKSSGKKVKREKKGIKPEPEA